MIIGFDKLVQLVSLSFITRISEVLVTKLVNLGTYGNQIHRNLLTTLNGSKYQRNHEQQSNSERT